MNIDEFIEEVYKLGIDVDKEKLEKLENYYNLLVFWNKKVNLTAITDKKMVYLKHFYDSLTILKLVDLKKIDNLCDIGTGAGFPGIVLKIFFPSIKLTLVDSLNKRINFLDVVVKELSLKDVNTIHIRAEEYSKIVRDKFDLVTARAVSSFNVLLEYSIPLVKKDKYFVAMRGNDDTVHSDFALSVLNSKILKKKTFYLPYEGSIRTIVVVKKTDFTSLEYPRKNTEIKKHPL